MTDQNENCILGGDEGPSSDRSALNSLPEGNRATVVVPVEPTEAMLDAGAGVISGGKPPLDYEIGNAGSIYEAMLSTAPPSVVGASEPVAWTSKGNLQLIASGRGAANMWRSPHTTDSVALYTAHPFEAENRSLREALEECRQVFTDYAEMHRQKLAEGMTDDEVRSIHKKVKRNAGMAEKCRQTLSRFPEQEGS